MSGNPDPGTLSRGGFHGAVSGLTPGRGAISTLSSDIARAVSRYQGLGRESRTAPAKTARSVFELITVVPRMWR